MSTELTLQEFYRRRERTVGGLKKYGLALLFLAPFLIGFIVFFIYPLFYGIYISFTNFNLSKPGETKMVGFQWYAILFNRNYAIKGTKFSPFFDSYWKAFIHTIIFVVIMVPIAIIIPLALAILINLKPPGYKIFRCLVYMPAIVPLACSGAIFVMLFNPAAASGILATLFPGSFFDNIKFFQDSVWFSFNVGPINVPIVYAWIPIFFMCFWGGWGGNFIIFSAGLENVPKSLYEASSVDGCNRWNKILHVTLPNIKGQLVLCTFTTIIGYMGLYGQNYTLIGGGPYMNKLLISAPAYGETSTLIYFIQAIVDGSNTTMQAKFYGLASAASIIYAILVGILTGIQQFLSRDKKSGTIISERYSKWIRVVQ